MMLSNDTDILLADLLALGLAVKGLYRAKDQTEGGTEATLAINLEGYEPGEDIPGEIQREVASITLSRSDVDKPETGGRFLVDSGKWEGEYIIASSPQLDDGGVVCDCRRDELKRARGAGARRLEGTA